MQSENEDKDIVSSVNIVELSQRINDAQYVVDIIKGKECILLLGKTGSGKTTTINYLNGTKLQRVKKDFGSGYEDVIEIANSEIGCGEIGHAMKSQTKSIGAYPLNTSLGNSLFADGALLIDSCGFEDTEGTAVDIANAIGLRNAIKAASNLRIVVLVNSASIGIDRGVNFKQLLLLIARFFSPIDQYLENLSFLFSHCERSLRYSDLKTKLRKCLFIDQFQNDQNLKKITERVVDFLDMYKEQVMLRAEDIAPSETDLHSNKHTPVQLLKILKETDPIPNSRLMCVSSPLSNEALTMLENTCLEANLNIQKYLKQEPYSQFRDVLDNLDGLKTLKENIELDQVSNQYQQAESSVRCHLEGDPERGDVPGLIKSALQSLLDKNFALFRSQMLNIENAQCLQSYVENIELTYQQILNKLNNMVKELAEPVILRLDTEPSDVKRLDTLLAITTDLSDFLVEESKVAYSNVVAAIEKRAGQLDQLCRDCLEKLQVIVDGNSESKGRPDFYLFQHEISGAERQPQLFVQLFDHLEKQRALKNFKSHVKPEWLQYYSNLQDFFCTILKNMHDEVFGETGLIVAIQNVSVSSDQCARFHHLHAIVDSCLKNGGEDHLNAEELYDFSKSIVDKTTSIVVDLLVKIEALCSTKEFAEVQKNLWVLQNITLNDGDFIEFHSKHRFNTEKMVVLKIRDIFEDCTRLQQELSMRDQVQKSDYDGVVKFYDFLCSAVCLDPLLFHDGTEMLQFGCSDIHACISLITAKASEEWEQRYLYVTQLIEARGTLQNYMQSLDQPFFASVSSEDQEDNRETWLENVQHKFKRIDQMVSLQRFLQIVETNSLQLKNKIEQSIGEVFLLVGAEQYASNTKQLQGLVECLTFWICFMTPLIDNERSLLFANLTVDETWIPKVVAKLVQQKESVIQFVINRLTVVKDSSQEAVQQFNAEILKENLDCLRDHCPLEKLVAPKFKPIHFYESTRALRREDIRILFKEAEKTMFAQSAEEEGSRALEISTKRRLFFENAAICQDHFPTEQLDFIAMASALQSTYRENLVKIPDEISELIKSSDFLSIKNKMQTLDGRSLGVGSQSNWSTQDKDTFEICDTMLCNFFKRLKSEIRGCASTHTIEESINFLKEALGIAQKAVVLQGLTSVDPLEVILLTFQTCDILHSNLVKRFENSLARYKFRAASSSYDLIMKFGDLDAVFENFGTVLCKDMDASGQDIEVCSSTLKPFAERNKEIFESSIDLLDQKLLKDCQELLTPKAPPISSCFDPHINVENEKQECSKMRADNNNDTVVLLQNTLTQPSPSALPAPIDLIAIRKLRSLFKYLKEVAELDEEDANCLFHGRVQFEDIKYNLENLVMQVTMQIHKSIQQSISELKYDEAKVFLSSMERLAGFIHEFDPVLGTQVIQQYNEQNDALKIARTCCEIGITAESFAFIPGQVQKLDKYLQTLKLDNYGKYVAAQKEIKHKLLEEAKQLGLDGKKQMEIMFESCDRIFEFISGLQQYEDIVSFLGNDEESMRLSLTYKQVFQDFSTKLYFSFEDKLREGKNIRSVQQELLKLKHAAAVSIQFANASLKTHLEDIVRHCENLCGDFSLQISNLQAAREELKQYDLFAVQNMERMLEQLMRLESQKDAAMGRQLGVVHEQGAGFDEVIHNMKAQLKGAVSKVTDMLNKLEYAGVAIGLSNIQILQQFWILHTDCKSTSDQIEELIRQRHSCIINEFHQEFRAHNYSAIDAIISEGSKLDKAFVEKFPSKFQSLMEAIKLEFRQELEKFFGQGQRIPKSVDDHSFVICQLKLLVSKISSLQIQEIVDSRIGVYIEELTRKGVDFYDLGISLVNHGPSGEEVTERYAEFKAVKTKRLNEAFRSAGITLEHALGYLSKEPSKLPESTLKELKNLHQQYETFSNDMLRQYLPGFNGFNQAMPLEYLVSSTKTVAANVSTGGGRNGKQCMLELLAAIFAVWTIQTSQQMFASRGGDEDCLIRPNVVQLLALFRLLGLDSANGWWSSNPILKAAQALFTGKKQKDSMEGHLIQVGTGEGKSVLLGGLSCLLALLGYEVSCASYSKHLSKRDYCAFHPLFGAFNVEHLIHYSTLSDLAENVINSRGDVRGLVEGRIFSNLNTAAFQANSRSKSQKQNRILIIDEVDVFFSEDFYGQTYNPACFYASSETREIMQHIWDYKSTSPGLKNIQALPAYQELAKKCCPPAKGLIDEQIRMMLQDVKNFNDPPYEVIDCDDGSKKIGYKVLDSVCTLTKHGYKTAFAYLFEVQRYPSLQVHLPNELALQLTCGSFSYAEIPQMDFSCIMGVTGTLTSLSAAEKSIISDEYNIKKQTIMPSIYGESKRKFLYHDIGVVVEFDLDRYYQLILKAIFDEREKGRAILVFFESEGSLNNFTSSSYGSQLQDINIVTERTENIPFYVSKATNPKEVTFFPKVFGRGLDFISRDQSVNSAGGVHVIQTFFSEYRSEEIQIMGRTARQAKEGSFQMIIFHENLAKYGLSEDEIKKVYPSPTFYEDVLMKKRDEFVATLIVELKGVANNAKQMHKRSQDFVSKLLDSHANLQEIVSTMRMFESGARTTQNPTHIVFCLDESGSMGNDWTGVVSAFSDFLQIRADLGASSDVVSVVQFSNSARVTMNCLPLIDAMNNTHVLNFRGGGTLFVPALEEASTLVANYAGVDAIIVFMTDGECSDAAGCPSAAASLYQNFTQGKLQFFGLAFKESVTTLKQMTCAIPDGVLLSATNVLQLRDQFSFIAHSSVRHGCA